MTSMPDKRQFKIAILFEDGPDSQLASYVERLLGCIENVIPGLFFKTSRHPLLGEGRTGHQSGLPSETTQAAREADAIVVCACHSSFNAFESDTGTSKLREELDLDLNIRPVRFPSSALEERSLFPPEKVRDLDVTFMSGFARNYNHGHIENLARFSGRYALRGQPSKAVHLVEQHDQVEMDIKWHRVISEVFATEFPSLILNHVPLETARYALCSAPGEINGIIIGEHSTMNILAEQIGGLVGANLLASATLATLTREGEDGPRIFGPVAAEAGRISLLAIAQATCLMLDIGIGLTAEANALAKAIRQTVDPIELIGSNMRTVDMGGSTTNQQFIAKLLENLDFHLDAANSIELAKKGVVQPVPSLVSTVRRPLGIIEKILTHAGVGISKPEVRAGEMMCVKVDWTLTSELLWAGMEKTYDQMGRPRPYRNDKLWLAVDHTVDPRTNHHPRQKRLIENAERFRREAKIIDYLPANTSIMHTDFTRDRAQPGRIVVGSDSHTCSAGSMGSFAVGFGAADVVMPMVTGETWFKVPEVCRINFVGSLPFGVGGKDVILHILGLFKRNTIAFQRAVEYGGPGLKELSMDARFAIANMNTELGGMGACFEADEITAEWIAHRPHPEHRQGGLYFRADPGAHYADERVIDLSEARLTMALYPDPDHVVPVYEKTGMKLDGCFIGACTTTEEDLIVGALVLEAGLRNGKTPISRGKRRVTPGSLTIIKNLERQGLLAIYRQAGFDIGAPGCSYCVGINDVDVAGEGEVWLSSQNRNFRNRMGKGSFGNITCAAAVAASSFDMEVTDPRTLLDQIDKKRFEKLVGAWKTPSVRIAPEINEPEPEGGEGGEAATMSDMLESMPGEKEANSSRVIRSRVQRFAENVDTDAIIPAEFMPGVGDADLGSHCFQYFRPEFRHKARNGSQIIVADHGFGSGSSREDAVRALLGTGIQAVIAKGFAFIYERNQLNMGLFNIKLQDDEFYTNVHEDSIVTIDKDNKTIRVEGLDEVFGYEQSEIEEALLDAGGVLPLYRQFGKAVFRQLTKTKKSSKGKKEDNMSW